jgi:hypothetical protein
MLSSIGAREFDLIGVDDLLGNGSPRHGGLLFVYRVAQDARNATTTPGLTDSTGRRDITEGLARGLALFGA